MNPIMKIIFAIIFISPIILAQEIKENENPYPKFIPYVVETDSIIKNFNINEIDNLGKEQPARWLAVDPLADKYPGWSPYNYTANNPLRFIDPDGREIVSKKKEDAEAAANMINSRFSLHGIENYKATVSEKTIKASWLEKLFGGEDHTLYSIDLEGSGNFRSNMEGSITVGDLIVKKSDVANGVFSALKSVIESKNTYNFNYTNDYNGKDISTQYGGGLAPGGGQNFYVSPLGNLNKNSNWYGTSPAATFFHEVVHLNNNILPGVPDALNQGYPPNMASRATQVMQPWNYFVPHR